MGDRGNIAVQGFYGGGRVYLYTHLGGSEVKQTLRRALDSQAGRNRRKDAAYLTRIIFDRLTEGTHGDEIGHGISPSLMDNEYPVPVVDTQTGTVTIEDATGTEITAPVPIEEFIDEQWAHLYDVRKDESNDG